MMPHTSTDILMITHNRPEYTALSLPALLDGCDEATRVWVWHNGADQRTRDVIRSLSGHPRLHRVHWSDTNEKLQGPTNWFWRQSTANYIGKVDDDCLLPGGWSTALRDVHEAVRQLGVVASSRLRQEDIDECLVNQKLRRFESGHVVMQNAWVAGSGYLMKRTCIERHGLLQVGESFPGYCIRLARAGWLNGFYYPFIFEDHFDDPRSAFTQYTSDEAFLRLRPLSADTYGARTVLEWTDSIRRNARLLQEAPVDPKHFSGWRRRMRSVGDRLRRVVRR
jgi:hypothetical protein